VLRIEKLIIGRLPPLSFSVRSGECLAIEAPSGIGKTRLLRAIADLDPARGRIFLDGIDRSELPAPEWRKRVRYVAAEPGWWTETPRPVFETLISNFKANAPVDDPLGDLTDPAARLDRLLGEVDLDPVLLDRPVAQLSTGERQRLALIRAMFDRPDVLLLDEPTGPLDPANTALVEEVLKYALNADQTIILVSHDSGQVGRLAHARLQLAPLAGTTTHAPSAHRNGGLPDSPGAAGPAAPDRTGAGAAHKNKPPEPTRR